MPQSLIVFPLNWPPVIRKPIAIPRAPCQAVSSVLWGQVDDLTTADVEDYVLNLDVEPGQIMLKAPLVPMIPAYSMQMTYMAGYGGTADTVPWPIRHGILMLTAALYENRGDTGTALSGNGVVDHDALPALAIRGIRRLPNGCFATRGIGRTRRRAADGDRAADRRPRHSGSSTIRSRPPGRACGITRFSAG